MADAVLSVELQARVDAFVQNLLNAANASTSTGSATTQMSSTISRNVANINRQNISQFTASLNAGTLAVQRLNQTPLNTRPIITGSNQAANALTNLGRVAQDAPFGFIGIQNNLNPLLESFQRLRAETGSNGAAFRALGSSLMGPAGLGIALSLVSSAITFYTMYQQKANKALNDAKKTTDDYVATLNQLDQVQVKGSQNAQKELTDLQALYSIATDTTISLKQRKQAVDELQETYPTYFGNIKDEEILLGNVGSAYDRLTQSIIATAKAEAAKNLITENSKKRLENAQKLVDLEAEQLLNEKKLDAARKRGTVSGGAGITAVAGSSGQGIAETAKINENLKARIDIAEEINKIDARNLSLTKEITNQVKLGADLTNLKDDKKPAKIKLPKSTELELPENTQSLIAELYRKISAINAPGVLKVKAPKGIEITGSKVPIVLPEFDTKKLKEQIEALNIQAGLDRIVEGAEKSIKDLVSLPSLVNLGAETLGQSFEAMGAAIVSGENVIVAAGAVIQKSFAELLSALGQQFITMGAAKVAAGILATPFGSKLVADGAGLIALGAGLKLGGGIIGGAGKSNKSNGGPTPFANGGIISGPTLGLMGEYAGAKSDPEVVAPLSKLKNLLGETDAMGNEIGSRSEPNILFEHRVEIDGNKLVVLTDRVRKQRDRIK